MPFYEAADHVFASPLQLDHIHTYTCILARSSHGPRVRRNTGEMFQSTRLKGQLTPSCLAARIVVVSPALFTCCPPFLFCRVVFILPSSRSFFFSPHFLGVHRVSRYIDVMFKTTFATTRNALNSRISYTGISYELHYYLFCQRLRFLTKLQCRN